MNDTSEVKLHFLDYWRVIKVRSGLIMLAFFLVMVTAAVTTYFLPKEYFSKVKMEVKLDNSGPIQPFGGVQQRTYDPQFVATQFQILQTTEILYPVIKRLDLVKELSPVGAQLSVQQVYFKLRKMMQLQEVRNTGLIEIGVYHTDPKLAANIANTIAIEYQDRRRRDIEKSVGDGLSQLSEGVDKQQKLVEEAARVAGQLRITKGINDPDPDNYGSQVGNKEGTRIQAQIRVNEQSAMVSQIRATLETIEKLTPEELMDVLRTLNIEDPTVSTHLPLYQNSKVEEARLLNGGIGEMHPRVRALRAQKEVHQTILTSALDSIRRSQATKLRVSEDAYSKLMDDLKKAEQEAIAEKTDIAAYMEAKNTYIQARRIRENAELTLKAERMKTIMTPNVVSIWEPAEAAYAPAKPNVPAYMALAGLVGIVVGVGLAFFIEYLDTSVKTLDDVERYLQIPVLAVIPKDINVLIKTQGDTPDAEAYRILRANVEFNKPKRDANTFTLISGGPGEGKSTTLNNLAFTCAKGGYNVLVVDADLRRPSQHRFFDVENNLGLTDYLSGKADIEEITRTTKIDNLSFIPSGQITGNDIGILNSQRMAELMQKLKHQYDLVFFDSPPILGVSDGSVLTSEVDMTIMVVQHRRFPRAMLQRVKQAVANVGGHLIGVVLNNVDSKHDDGYGYYSSYNDYYAPKKAEPGHRETTTVGTAVAPRPRASSGEDY